MEVISLEAIAQRIDAIKEQRDALSREEKLLKGEVQERYGDRIKQNLSAKDEPFGAVNVQDGEWIVCVTIPKKVKYDQKKLAALWQQIQASGDDPTQYINVEFDVSETKFKGWPDVIRNEFIDGRTTEPGTPTVTIKRRSE